MKEMWDDRYSGIEYAYGTNPNSFLEYAIEKYNQQGKILFPGEGEGRNAVFAAIKGLESFAFDISEEGKQKALKLANQNNVTIDYQVGDFLKMNYSNNSFDAASLIYCHFPLPLLSAYHKKIGELVKPGGLIILEGFSKNHLPLREKNPKVGGPNKIEMLFSKESIRNDFLNFEFLELEEIEIELNEGLFHKGTGKVIRFIGRKKN